MKMPFVHTWIDCLLDNMTGQRLPCKLSRSAWKVLSIARRLIGNRFSARQAKNKRGRSQPLMFLPFPQMLRLFIPILCLFPFDFSIVYRPERPPHRKFRIVLLSYWAFLRYGFGTDTYWRLFSAWICLPMRLPPFQWSFPLKAWDWDWGQDWGQTFDFDKLLICPRIWSWGSVGGQVYVWLLVFINKSQT